jgi:hypothetical protein
MKWFKHDISTRDSDAVFELIERHGIQGYGFYWVILEECLSADASGFKIQITETWCKRISKRFNITDFRTVYRMLDTMAEVGVINAQLWADQVIFSSEVAAKSDSYIKEKELAAERKRKQRVKEKEQMSRVTSCDIANVTPVTLSDPDPDLNSLSSSSSVVPEDIGVSFDTTRTVEAEPDQAEHSGIESASVENSSLAASDSLVGTPPSSAAPPQEKGKRKAAKLSKAAKVYSTLRELETFEKLWLWYRGMVESRGERAGDKAAAALAWRDVIEADWDRIEDFRLGCSLFFKGEIKSGIPHLNNFIGGSTKHPTPYWQTALEYAKPVTAGADSFIPQQPSGRRIFEAKPVEIDPSTVEDGLARMRAAMKLSGAKNDGLSA